MAGSSVNSLLCLPMNAESDLDQGVPPTLLFLYLQRYFVPLSLNIALGQPHLAVILTNAFIKLPVSRDVAITRWHQCVCKHRKRQKYILVRTRPRP